jgi:hypothetical protein
MNMGSTETPLQEYEAQGDDEDVDEDVLGRSGYTSMPRVFWMKRQRGRPSTTLPLKTT